MKIAFVGKGGSGKTTLCSLFARECAKQEANVLAFDADINQHLGEALGFSPQEIAKLPELGNDQLFIKEYLRGENKLISTGAEMIKTTPPGRGSRLLSVSGSNPIFDRYSLKKGPLRFFATGSFQESDIGVACYHSKTGAVELLLNHLIDRPQEPVLVDMTAGADAFASGLFTRFDLLCIVAEPTRKSLAVIHQFLEHAQTHDVRLAVIGNKTRTKEDRDFILHNSPIPPMAFIGDSAMIRSSEKTGVPANAVEGENQIELQKLYEYAAGLPKNWKRYFAQAGEFHIKNAESWANEFQGIPLQKHFDPTFDLESAVLEIVSVQ